VGNAEAQKEVNLRVLKGLLMSDSWVFQANPKKFDIDSALQHLKEFTWLTAQHRSKIHTGDIAYIWKSGKAAALVCKTTVLSEPAEMENTDAENRFCVDQLKFRGPHWRVRIRIDQVFPRPITRSKMLSNRILGGMRVFKGQEATNIHLGELATCEIENLIRSEA
jgi:5-methylcytosine-specific restriction enzyme B